jgi:hypothetical protein
LLSANAGCHSIRKKFVRKKKSTQEVPVYVDFKEYSQKPSREAYNDYYIFFRGWLDDLVLSLKKGVSHKRELRAVNEAIMNLEQIISFYSIEGREKVYPFYEELLNVKEEVKKGSNMSEIRRNSLIRRIEGFKRRFEKEFNYSDAEKWMN